VIDDGRWGEALEMCLEQAARAGEPADAVLARFPDLAGDLRALVDLAAALRALPALPAPSDAFRARLESDLAVAPPPRALVRAGASRVTTAPFPAASPFAAAPVTAAPAAPTDALVRALDVLLERVRRDGIAPAVALADHPELAEELRPLLALSGDLAALAPVDGPSDSFRARLAADLVAAPPPRSLAVPAPRGLPLWRRLWRSTAFMAAATATVILFLGAGATYASASARPGDWLYPVKRAVEGVRMLVATDATSMQLHLALADRRLAEARADRAFAGAMLAEFSREVTAALADADRALDAGTARAAVVDPLLAWLLGARAHLVEGREALPPTAWRAALALVDEAIAALTSGRTLSVAPVPRLPDRVSALHAHAPADHLRDPTAVARRRGRPDEPVAGGTLVANAPGSPDGGPSRDARAVYVVATAAVDGVRGAEPAPQPTGAVPPEPTRARPPRTRVPTPATAAPAPTEPAPVVPPSATVPAVPSAVPTETGAVPVLPTTTPTSPAPTSTDVPPAPTAVVLNKPPAINDVYCDERVLDLGKSTACHVVAYDPEGEPLHYLWVSDVPQMLSERQQDATYYGAWGIGGGTLRVRITVYVSDRGEAAPDGPDVARAETYVDVRMLDTGRP
jgi:hypothetical protein